MFLFSGPCGLRGDVIPDLAHRRNNAYMNAWHLAGLTVIKFELGLIFNIFRGPFHGCANFGTLKEAGQELYRNFTAYHPFFNFCYETICKCKGDAVHPNRLGTESHMLEVWRSLPDSKIWTTAGSGCKLSRWMAWIQKARHILPYWGEILLVLLYLGMVEGFYDNVNELPVVCSIVTTPSVEAAAGAAEGVPAAPSCAVTSSAPVPMSSTAPLSKQAVKGPRDGTEEAVTNPRRTLELP